MLKRSSSKVIAQNCWWYVSNSTVKKHLRYSFSCMWLSIHDLSYTSKKKKSVKSGDLGGHLHSWPLLIHFGLYSNKYQKPHNMENWQNFMGVGQGEAIPNLNGEIHVCCKRQKRDNNIKSCSERKWDWTINWLMLK